MVWDDEFDVDGPIDPNKWEIELHTHNGNHEFQDYTDHLDNLRVENGELVIEAKSEDSNGMTFTSAR